MAYTWEEGDSSSREVHFALGRQTRPLAVNLVQDIARACENDAGVRAPPETPDSFIAATLRSTRGVVANTVYLQPMPDLSFGLCELLAIDASTASTPKELRDLFVGTTTDISAEICVRVASTGGFEPCVMTLRLLLLLLFFVNNNNNYY